MACQKKRGLESFWTMSGSHRILVVEDDEQMAHELADSLIAHGYGSTLLSMA